MNILLTGSFVRGDVVVLFCVLACSLACMLACVFCTCLRVLYFVLLEMYTYHVSLYPSHCLSLFTPSLLHFLPHTIFLTLSFSTPEIVRSLKELLLGFAGELTMSDAMDTIKTCLYLDRIPPSWQKRAWPSLRPLSSWLTDFNLRLTQLEEWQNNPADIPKVTWLSGLYNPQSFLTVRS